MNAKSKVLVSGTSSGLGKYLFKKIGTHKYKRNFNIKKYEKINWDLIVHCGFYTGDDIVKAIESIKHSYLLSKLESKKTIFISSLIVYQNSINTKESSKLNLIDNSSLYCKSKIISESFFNNQNNTILRLGTLIGENMRKNNIYKILNHKNPKLSLTKDSLYSFIDYAEILDFILKRKYKGVYNFNRDDYLTLDEISKKICKNFTYGNFHFKCIKADNNKLKRDFDLKKYSSIKLIKKYCKKNEV